MHQVGDIFELNIKFRCQKVKKDILLIHIVHLLDKHNKILQNALHIHQEHNVVANDFLESASRRRCVYVSGFFNDVASTVNTNFVLYFDRVQAGAQTEI